MHEHCLIQNETLCDNSLRLEVVNFYHEQSRLRCGFWLRLQLLENVYFQGTFVSIFMPTSYKSAAILTINLISTWILLNIQKQFSRSVLQIYKEFTGEHPRICVVFINLNCRFGCSPINVLHICRIPFFHFVRKPLGDCF